MDEVLFNPFPPDAPKFLLQWYAGMSFEAGIDVCYDRCMAEANDTPIDQCLPNCTRMFQQSFLISWNHVQKHVEKTQLDSSFEETQLRARQNAEATQFFSSIRRPKLSYESTPIANSERAQRPENFDLSLATFTEDPFREIDIRKRAAEMLSRAGREKAAADEELRTAYYKRFPFWPISTGSRMGPAPRYGPTAWRSRGYQPMPPPWDKRGPTAWGRSRHLAEEDMYKFAGKDGQPFSAVDEYLNAAKAELESAQRNNRATQQSSNSRSE